MFYRIEGEEDMFQIHILGTASQTNVAEKPSRRLLLDALIEELHRIY